MTAPLCHAIASRALIRLDGEEATRFLDDLLTANIANIGKDEVQVSALLTPQGRILFDMLISHDGDAVLLECDSALRDELMAKLTLYRMRRKITIESDARAVHAVIGDCKGALRDTRFAHGVMRFYGDAPDGMTVNDDPHAYPRMRWRAGIAEGAGEMLPGKALPLEMRLDKDGGIDFRKGCYIGQEVTARTRYRGLVKRSIAPVRIAGGIVADTLPLPVMRAGREAGTLLAAAPDDEAVDGMIGLATIRLEALADPDTPLSAGEVRLTPFLPPRLLPLPGAEIGDKAGEEPGA